MTHLSFLIIPDDPLEPCALFADLEDAIAWALERYGSDRFRVTHRSVVADEGRHAQAS